MLITTIDVSHHADHPDRPFPGWGVSVSKRAWERCVAVPKKHKGVSEEDRVNDLLEALWAAAQLRMTGGSGWHVAITFTTEIHRTGLGRLPIAHLLWRYRPAEPLVAMATLDPLGRPCLLVLAPEESPAWDSE